MFVSKRILFIIGVVVVIIMLGAGVGVAYAFNALSQQRTTDANLSATATAQASITTPTTGVQNANGQRRLVGVIQSLNAQSFTLAVTTKKAKRVITVNVSSATTYRRGGKAAGFSDLQVGETVAVLGTLDAPALSMQATRVMLSPKSATPAASATSTATP